MSEISEEVEMRPLVFKPRDEEEVRLLNAPLVIWLQTGTAVCDSVGDLDFKELSHENTTWCQDEIEYGDVKYVRFDAYDALLAQRDALLEAAKAATKYDDAIRRRGEDGDYNLDPKAAIAEGVDLDELYYDWITKARAAIQQCEDVK